MRPSYQSVAFAVLTAMVATIASVMPAQAQSPEQRLGLVIGNGEYAAGALPTAANDAGLVAQTLQAAGFDVMGARDLDADALRNTFRDFVDRVAAAGQQGVVFVYLSGHAVQFEGENYFVPVDARIARDVDVPLRALRLNDYIRPLAAANPKAVVVVLDAARQTPFGSSAQPLAGGLALVEPTPGVLYAFNAAPGTVGSMPQPPYSAYAQALAEMLREGGLRIETVFDRTRLRVHEATSGAELPWHASALKVPVFMFERAPDAPADVSLTTTETRLARPVSAFDDAREAYLAALERDTLQGYLDFLRAYPDHALAKRVRAIVAARREAITWRRARNADTPEAYWTYLDRYPNGPHAHDARRRLAFLTAPPEPPPRYTTFVYDIPPPEAEEIIFVRRSYVYFADPVYAFVPPPPPPLFFLPPPPPPLYFAPPPPPVALFVLPVPVYRPVPVYVRAPAYVAPPPPTNPIFRNLHGAGPVGPGPAIVPPAGGPPLTGAPSPSPAIAPVPGATPGVIAAGAAAGAVAGAAAAAAILPPSVKQRAAVPPGGGTPGGGTAPTLRPGPTPAGIPPASAPGVSGAPPVTSPGPATVPGRPPLPSGTALPTPTPPTKSGPPAGAAVPPAGAIPPGKGVPPAPSPGAASGPLKGPPLPGTVGKAPERPLPGQPAGQPGARPATPPPPVTSPPASVSSSPKLAPRQERVDRAQQDRGAVERQLQEARQREMARRKEEAAQQARARQGQQQAQDIQRQRQQQMEAQRRAMDAQRQQQQAAQAAARAQAEAAARARAQQVQQQQAAARAQAEAAARARAQQQQTQQRRPPCGAPGLPPCPK